MLTQQGLFRLLWPEVTPLSATPSPPISRPRPWQQVDTYCWLQRSQISSDGRCIQSPHRSQGQALFSRVYPTTDRRSSVFRGASETITCITAVTLTCKRVTCGFHRLLCSHKVQTCSLFTNRSLFAYSPAPNLLKQLICCNPCYRSHLLTGITVFWAVPLCEPRVCRHGWSFADCLIIE